MSASILSLQQVMAIIVGVGVANALDVYFRDDLSTNRLPKWAVDTISADTLDAAWPIHPVALISLILLLVMALRFYHFNACYLDDEYRTAKPSDTAQASRKPKRPRASWYFFFEFFMVAFEALLVAGTGFFVRRPAVLLAAFAAILIVDGLWAAVGLRSRNIEWSDDHNGEWLLWNLISGALLVPVALLIWTNNYGGAALILGTGLLALNSWHCVRHWNRQFGFAPSSPESRGSADAVAQLAR